MNLKLKLFEEREVNKACYNSECCSLPHLLRVVCIASAVISGALAHLSKSGFLTDLDLTGWARLAGQGASGACLCLCASAEIIGGCHHGVLWGLSSVLVLVRQYPEPRNLAEFKEIKCPGRTYLLLFMLNLCPQPNAEAVAEAVVTFPHQHCSGFSKKPWESPHDLNTHLALAASSTVQKGLDAC